MLFPSVWLLLALGVAGSVVQSSALRAAETARLEMAPAADHMREVVETLADDTFEGREAGSRGGRAAAGFLLQEFRRLGLAPGGPRGGYLQSFGASYQNILGILAGQDPELSQEYIVISGHYDHVGYGSRSNSMGPIGYIHNGADDNASGCALLLGLAELCTQAQPARRSLYFALWDAEEKGLLGSQHWLANCPIPRDKIRMMINLDMVGRLRDNRLEVYGSRTMAGLRMLVSQANRQSDLSLDFLWDHKPNSDHDSFFVRSIPYLMFHTGLHEDYHRPSDDAERVDVEGIRRVGALVYQCVRSVADAPQLGPFRDESRLESESTRRQLETPLPPLPARLGIRWDPNSLGAASHIANEDGTEGQVPSNEEIERAEAAAHRGDSLRPRGGPYGDSAEGTESESRPVAAEAVGLRVAAVRAGSPADLAGIRTGMILVAFNGWPIRDPQQFVARVWRAAPDTVLTVLPSDSSESPREVPVRLTGQPIRLGISWRTDAAEPQGATIVRVVPGTAAAQAGVRLGDRLLRIDGHPVQGETHLEPLARQAEFPIELELERAGRIFTVTLVDPVEEPTHSGHPLGLRPPAESGEDRSS